MGSQQELQGTVTQLGVIHGSLLGEVSDPGTLHAAAMCLDHLAVALRDADSRLVLSSTQLPSILASILDAGRRDRTGLDREIWYELVFQAGRAAANLAADCDEGRAALAAAKYPVFAIDLLLPARNLPLVRQRSLVISLLNLTINNHEQTLATVNEWKSLGVLLKSATQVCQPDLLASEDHWAVSKLLWTIAGKIIDSNVDQLAETATTADLAPFGLLPELMLPETIAKLPKDGLPLVILRRTSSILDKLSATEKVPLEASYGAGSDLIDRLADFVDRGQLPESSSAEEEDDEDDEDVPPDEAKELATAKAEFIKSIVNLSGELKYDDPRGRTLWVRMRGWLGSPREDLLYCALLVFGNVARKDATARRLVAGEDSLLPSIDSLFKPSTPVLVQHGLIGLLRNLSVLADNREQLFRVGILDKLMRMGVWARERDLVGSVQGGAITIYKHLCRDNSAIASSFVHNKEAVIQLLDLIDRSDDAPMKWEGSRVFVNATRSIARDGNNNTEEIAILSEDRILEVLAMLLRTSANHAVLLNEAIIALALLASFGPADTNERIAGVLDAREGVTDAQRYASGLDILQAVVKREADAPQVAEEIRQNAEKLLGQLPRVPPRIEAIE